MVYFKYLFGLNIVLASFKNTGTIFFLYSLVFLLSLFLILAHPFLLLLLLDISPSVFQFCEMVRRKRGFQEFCF